MKKLLVMMMLMLSVGVWAEGVLDIVTNPSNSEVYVDNKFFGYTPLLLSGIPSGTHTLTVRSGSSQDYVRNFYVQDGQTTSLNIDLHTEAGYSTHNTASYGSNASNSNTQYVDNRSEQKQRTRVKVRNVVLGGLLLNEFSHGKSASSKDRKDKGRSILGGLGLLNEIFNR